MLAILCLDICVSYLPWYTFVPIMSQGMDAYGAEASDLNVLSILYSVMYVPGFFLCCTLLRVLGCHSCFVLSTVLLTVGCALRCGTSAFVRVISLLPPEPEPVAPFRMIVVGQAFCAMGQTFLVNATSQFGAEWFPTSERPAAAMISNLMNFVGGSLSFMVPTWYVSPSARQPEAVHEQISALLAFQLKASLAALALTVAFFRDPPRGRERGPSGGASVVERLASTTLFAELRAVLALRDFWCVGCSFVLYLTVLNTFDAVEGSLLVSYGYSESLSSSTAASFCVVSVISTLLESTVIRHPAHYRKALLVINGLLGSFFLMGLVILRNGMPEWCFVAAVGFMGLSTPGWGCSVEIGSEACYPAREATVSSLLEALGSMFSALGIVVAQWLIDGDQAAAVMLAMAASCVVGACSLACFSGRLRRHEAEEVAEAEEAVELEAKHELGTEPQVLGHEDETVHRRTSGPHRDCGEAVELQSV